MSRVLSSALIPPMFSGCSAYARIANGGYNRVAGPACWVAVDGRGHVRADFLTATRTRVIPETCIEPNVPFSARWCAAERAARQG